MEINVEGTSGIWKRKSKKEIWIGGGEGGGVQGGLNEAKYGPNGPKWPNGQEAPVFKGHNGPVWPIMTEMARMAISSSSRTSQKCSMGRGS